MSKQDAVKVFKTVQIKNMWVASRSVVSLWSPQIDQMGENVPRSRLRSPRRYLSGQFLLVSLDACQRSAGTGAAPPLVPSLTPPPTQPQRLGFLFWVLTASHWTGTHKAEKTQTNNTSVDWSCFEPNACFIGNHLSSVLFRLFAH